jgi:general secretion pathway protein C
MQDERLITPAFVRIRHSASGIHRLSCAVPNIQSQLPDSVGRVFSGPIERFYERHGRHLPALTAAVFALLLGRALADLAWSLVPVPEPARWQPPPVASSSTRSTAAVDINTIVNAHLFGRYETAPAETALLSAPETPLNLTLVGLLADDRENYSRALIAVQNADEKGYAIGDDVTRGVTLQAIFPDRVILSRNGRLETLSLEKGKPSSGGASYAPPATVAEPDASAESSAQQLTRIREEILQDPAKASEYVRVQPANVGGQLKGYRVYPGRDRAIFTNAGLRPGDLVTSVNGVQLDDPAKALQLLGDLSQAGQLNLVVERGGQAQNISITLN